ncbi:MULTISPECIES: hypothetical protein [unclassified Bacillus cereus group]|uniref:hypothetical protein n=1 Tax=unclassified Bacillus cereus group TaxID=2750818 RepID=UPI001298E976|nr:MULTISPECIES: hypothetical protein [unclassified Bacillus cereus group]MEB8716467.1 hypothetical protein [Bacillus cereus]MRB05785.1 hypothetical protein [Bacillus thuringiensis]MEB9434999.1 hypothetical protein [Bacillus cereus]MEB9482203.1 hypothetical protein [Bacillus cereus]MRC49797.1 hypothetical protein [Bacillus thuringiensis]
MDNQIEREFYGEMEEGYYNLLYLENIKWKEKKIQLFNECKSMYSIIMDKDNRIQKKLKNMNPLIKGIIRRNMKHSYFTENYLQMSSWVDRALNINRIVGLFTAYENNKTLLQVINDLLKTRTELKFIEFNISYLERLLFSIEKETNQIKLVAISNNWKIEKYRSEIEKCIKSIISTGENVKCDITFKKTFE